MKKPPLDQAPRPLWSRRIWLFYIGLIVVVGALIWRFPEAVELVTVGAPTPSAIDGEITGTMVGDVPLASPVTTGWASVWITALSLLGALVVMIPVAWTYILIKRRTGYEESVVHTLLILPVAVTGIVIIVKGSLALAFSLAGIVAAVRFRTTLEDTKDAVYVFLAIGVGLAAGVQALGVALVLSVVFNALNLVLWRLSFGNVYVDQMKRTGGVSLGSALAGPDSGGSALTFGDDRLMAALSPKDLREVAQHQARMANYLRQESDQKKERKRYFVLMIYAAATTDVQSVVEEVLQRTSIRWQLAEILPGADGGSVLEYLVRPQDQVSESALLAEIRRAGGAALQAAELRSLKKLAERES